MKKVKKILVKTKAGKTLTIRKNTKPCPECGQDLIIDKAKITKYNIKRVWWVCSDPKCKHSELSENSSERATRFGFFDKAIGILPLTNFD